MYRCFVEPWFRVTLQVSNYRFPVLSEMGGKALINSHPKSISGSKGARRCRVCGRISFTVLDMIDEPFAQLTHYF